MTNCPGVKCAKRFYCEQYMQGISFISLSNEVTDFTYHQLILVKTAAQEGSCTMLSALIYLKLRIIM